MQFLACVSCEQISYRSYECQSQLLLLFLLFYLGFLIEIHVSVSRCSCRCCLQWLLATFTNSCCYTLLSLFTSWWLARFALHPSPLAPSTPTTGDDVNRAKSKLLSYLYISLYTDCLQCVCECVTVCIMYSVDFLACMKVLSNFNTL